MDKYTASNGAQIVLTNARQTGYVLVEKDDDVASAYLGFEEMVAWREFFQAERDEELGRWRSRSNPDIWVMADADDPNRILLVSEPLQTFAVYMRAPNGNISGDNGGWGGAIAHDYFDAHPERKPWEDAQEEEVWLLTINGDTGPFIAHEDALMGLVFTTANGTRIQSNDDEITAARRIWPES